jgi:5-methylcytosine-specific restriction endonuclease McrA
LALQSRDKLNDLLQNGQFGEHEKDFIDEMYQFYIFPFKQHNGTGKSEPSCHTSQSTSSHPSSVEDKDYIPEEEEKLLTQKDLKKAVLKRDGVCLFCWTHRPIQGYHILAQMDFPFPYNETALFSRTGLKQKHQVQNRLLLCSNCHIEFDALKKYVDVVDDKFIVKVVNETDDASNLDWIAACGSITVLRSQKQTIYEEFGSRQVVNQDGEMELYFLTADQSLFPNKSALEFHKTACLIWRMAGGGESDDEYCPDEEVLFVPAGYDVNKVRKWLMNSVDTLNILST